VQLALNVTDLDEAVDFYSKLFQTEPAKRRPGYANFAVVDPPLKLVLFENPSQAGTLNHLGVEVGTADDVVVATRRLSALGLQTDVEDGVTCCHALQDKSGSVERVPAGRSTRSSPMLPRECPGRPSRRWWRAIGGGRLHRLLRNTERSR